MNYCMRFFSRNRWILLKKKLRCKYIVVQANWSPLLPFFYCVLQNYNNIRIFSSLWKIISTSCFQADELLPLLRERTVSERGSSATNWILSGTKRFVCLKQIWSDLWIELLIIDTNRVELLLFGGWLIELKVLIDLHFNFSSGSWRTDGVCGDVMWWWWWCPDKSGCELWCKWLKPVVNPLPIEPTLEGDIKFDIADDTLTDVPSWRLWWWWWLWRWSFELDWLVGMLPFDVLLLFVEPEPTRSWRHRPDVSVIWSNPLRSIICSG